MKVVGVDFGTTNVRISIWDPDGDAPPQPVAIGTGPDGTVAMPAVVALRRLRGGDVSVIVGEEADSEMDDPNETLVIRNIKRYALSNDSYVNKYLEVANAREETPKWPPDWWKREERCVEAWGRRFPVWDLIGSILEEAFSRANVSSAFEWRAGCPVHAGLDYREQLTRTLSKITGGGNIDWITPEPILFMNLIRRLGDVDGAPISGSYLVYDFGGGSLDCALVDIDGDEGRMIVFGADGHPLLGGSDIDRALVKRFSYEGQLDLLRKAKERLGPDNRSETLLDGTVITLDELESTLTEGGFVDRSVNPMRDAYMGAKVLWKRGGSEDDPPIGEVLARNVRTGEMRFVWQLRLGDMARDLKGIILFGGPTKSPHFREGLQALFEERIEILDASDLLPTLIGVADLETVGASMGACYTYGESYSPLHVNRLPVRVTLENLNSGDRVEYEPFESLTKTFSPFEDFVSGKGLAAQSKSYGQKFRLTMSLPDGGEARRYSVGRAIDQRAVGSTLRLVIDRLGRVGVQETPVKAAGERAVPRRIVIVPDTPWQTGRQRAAIRGLFDQQRRYEERQQERTSLYINRPPWEYPTA